jgi:ElaB/YqjD/DUF883 family membrane-anchored ribosome-binding protein
VLLIEAFSLSLSSGSLLLDACESIKDLGKAARSVVRQVKNREQAEVPPSAQLAYIKKSANRARDIVDTLLVFSQQVTKEVNALLENASATNKLSVDQIQKELIEIFNKFEATDPEWEHETKDGRAILTVLKGIQSLLSNTSDEIAATSSKPKRSEGKGSILIHSVPSTSVFISFYVGLLTSLLLS